MCLFSSVYYLVTWKGEGTWSVVPGKTIIGNERGTGKDVNIKVERKIYTATIMESGKYTCTCTYNLHTVRTTITYESTCMYRATGTKDEMEQMLEERDGSGIGDKDGYAEKENGMCSAHEAYY